MKVVTAIDSFKGSMTSMEAGFAAAEGIHRVDADAEVQVRPLADGGEGTVEALVAGMNGKTEHVKVTGPLGEPVICEYGIIESTKTAVIEMAGAAGITQVPDEKRNPLYTTTYGVGEVIKDAIEKGCRRFIVGIGGSATNDGGVGMLQALGYAFLDKDGKQVLPGARGLKDITEITAAYVIPELAECKFRVACDVTNPLCGELGCSAIYGPQKGATPEMIQDMDQWLGAYAELAKERFPKADPKYPGTGAAGGMGFAFLTFTDAVLESGIQIVLEETKLREYVKDADLVIEAIAEDPKQKDAFYAELAKYLPESTILVTNSSTLLPSQIAASTGRPEKFLALHFANRIWRNNTAEVMGHPGTDQAAYDEVVRFAGDLGMVPLQLHKEQPGYILNSMLVPFLNAAEALYATGVADPETIDKTWMLGTGAPLGPFRILDIVGLTTAYNIVVLDPRTKDPDSVPAKIAAALKERIDKQVVVKKARSGGSTVEVIV